MAVGLFARLGNASPSRLSKHKAEINLRYDHRCDHQWHETRRAWSIDQAWTIPSTIQNSVAMADTNS